MGLSSLHVSSRGRRSRFPAMRDVWRQQRLLKPLRAGAAAIAAEETPVALAQEAREAAALVGVAAEGPDDRGLLPTPAERPAGRRVGGRDGAGAGGVAAQRTGRRRPPRVQRRRRRAAAAAAPAPAVSRRRRRARGFVERGIQRAPRRRRAAAGDLAAGRVAVTVDGRTLALKRENVVAARSASPPRAAPAAAAAAATAAAADRRARVRRRRAPRLRPGARTDAVLAADGRPAYAIVARALDAVSATRSRLAKENALTNA